MPGAGVMPGAIAARTTRIHLRPAVTVLSSDDPVRVFQRYSTLSAISGGRAEVISDGAPASTHSRSSATTSPTTRSLVDHQRGNPVAPRHDGQREHVPVERDRPVQVAQIQQRGLNAEPHLRHPFGGPAEVGGGVAPACDGRSSARRCRWRPTQSSVTRSAVRAWLSLTNCIARTDLRVARLAMTGPAVFREMP